MVAPAVPRRPHRADGLSSARDRSPDAVIMRLLVTLCEVEQFILVERILLLVESGGIIGYRHEEPGGNGTVQKARPLQFVEARQILDGRQHELLQEGFGGAVGHRRPGVRRRPRIRIQPVSIRTSSVPLEVETPRISSISARVTGW